MTDPDGYETPYAKFLEDHLAAIEKILGQLILDYGEHKPIDHWIEAIEQWLGDDWDFALSPEDQRRHEAIKGWTHGD